MRNRLQFIFVIAILFLNLLTNSASAALGGLESIVPAAGLRLYSGQSFALSDPSYPPVSG